MTRVAVLVLVLCAALPAAAAAPDPAQPRTLAGHLTIASSPNGLTTAVVGRRSAEAPAEFLFCITHRQRPANAIAYRGPGKVTYRPQPIAGLPPGVVISGPEPIAPMLAVAPEAGQAMVFAGQGQSPPADAALRGARSYAVNGVMRMDWAPPGGPRRGTDMEGCLAPGG